MDKIIEVLGFKVVDDNLQITLKHERGKTATYLFPNIDPDIEVKLEKANDRVALFMAFAKTQPPPLEIG
jgi:hypothetical protein